MISLTNISYSGIILILLLFCSCTSVQSQAAGANPEMVAFTEMRRLNTPLVMKEVSTLSTFVEVLNLYKKLEDPKMVRSFPIPVLEDEEMLILIKPVLKKEKYGDLEITDLQKKGENLIIHYKEIKNFEYENEKVSQPLLIIKVKNSFKTIALILNS